MNTTNQLVPLPDGAGGIELRVGTLADLDFIDALQKKQSKAVGWMARGTLEGKIALGDVLVAQSDGGERIGYCIATDRYFKREDVGAIYQVNVVPGRWRGLVGAALVKGTLARWPWGVRLACCWCAQDLVANKFWEALGFVPLAYRGGSTRKKRVHIFWQRRVRADDECDWWYPSQTTGGSIREDRLVLPIPPDQHWSALRPVLLPGMRDAKQIEGEARAARPARARVPKAPWMDPRNISSGGFRFGPAFEPTPEPVKAVRKPAVKNDPALVRKVRALRDIYLAEVNDGRIALEGGGKYDVAKALPAREFSAERQLLSAA